MLLDTFYLSHFQVMTPPDIVTLLVLMCCAAVDGIWRKYNLKVEADTPEPIHHDEDWHSYVRRDFAAYDLDWDNHSEIARCSRVLDTPVPTNTPDRALLTCPAHLTVDTSCIPHAGLGVWTRDPIPRMSVFGPFEGERVANDSISDHLYGWNLNVVNWRANQSIVADDPATSNWMRYVNSARNYVELNLKKYVDHSGDVYYIALEDIAPYTELLINYPQSFNINPALFWSGDARANLTYAIFNCKLCNKSSYSPLLTKQHILEEHNGNHPDIQNKLDNFVSIQNPPEGLFEKLMHKNQTNSTDSIKPHRRKRSVTDIDSQTKHHTTSRTTAPFETTTQKHKHLNLHFDSHHNLEEKIKQRLRDAGIDFEDGNTTLPANATQQTHAIYNDEFMNYVQKSSDGSLPANEFQDFIRKLKVLKTHGTLNVSQEKEDHAVNHYTPSSENGTNESDDTPIGENISNNTEQIMNNMRNLLNVSTISINQTRKITYETTTERIKKQRTRKTATPCTCPTYSDYRMVWHNISLPVDEPAFKINETNNMVQIRHRWYNESSEPQYGDVSTCDDTNNTLRTTRKRVRTSENTQVRRTRKKKTSTDSKVEATGHLESSKTKMDENKITEIGISTKTKKNENKIIEIESLTKRKRTKNKITEIEPSTKTKRNKLKTNTLSSSTNKSRKTKSRLKQNNTEGS